PARPRRTATSLRGILRICRHRQSPPHPIGHTISNTRRSPRIAHGGSKHSPPLDRHSSRTIHGGGFGQFTRARTEQMNERNRIRLTSGPIPAGIRARERSRWPAPTPFPARRHRARAAPTFSPPHRPHLGRVAPGSPTAQQVSNLQTQVCVQLSARANPRDENRFPLTATLPDSRR